MTKKKKSMIDKLAALARIPKSDPKQLEELQGYKRDTAGQIEDLKSEVGRVEAKMLKLKKEYDLRHGARRTMVGLEITAALQDLKRLQEKQAKLFDSKDIFTALIRDFELKAVADAEKAIGLPDTIEDLIGDKHELIEEAAETRKLFDELDGLTYESEERLTLPGALEDTETFELPDEVKQTLAALQANEARDVSGASVAPEAKEAPEEE